LNPVPAVDESWSGEIVKILVNGELRDFASGTTIAQLLETLRLDPRTLAVELNLDVIPRGRHAECLLHDGDRLEIVTLVGGG
jgi:sulfur carrier protein